MSLKEELMAELERVVEQLLGEQEKTEGLTLTGEADMTFEIKREGGVLTAMRSDSDKPWYILLVGVESVTPNEDVTMEKTPMGLLITPAPNANVVSVKIISE